MTREELKGIVEGISEEQLKAILDINTSDIGKAKKCVDDLKSEIEVLKTDKKDLETRIGTLNEKSKTADEYKKELDSLKADITAKEEAAKKEKADSELTAAIEAVFGDKEFSSEYVRNGIIADMKKEIAKPENKGKGYDKIFEALTKDKEGIFANPNPPADMLGMGSFSGGEISNAQARAVMGLPPEK